MYFSKRSPDEPIFLVKLIQYYKLFFFKRSLELISYLKYSVVYFFPVNMVQGLILLVTLFCLDQFYTRTSFAVQNLMEAKKCRM